MKRTTAVGFIFILALTGCFGGGGGVQYRDTEKAKGSREWGPKEIKITVNTMVRSLYSYLKNDWNKPALIQVRRIRNRTAEHINTSLISDEIVQELIRRRIQFVDDTHTADAIREMEKGMTGMIDPESAIPVGQLKSPNFYLFGEISENVRYVGNKRIQYLVVTLKLTSLSTRMLVWQERQEFLKSSKVDRVSF
jgi:hypothetical protein